MLLYIMFIIYNNNNVREKATTEMLQSGILRKKPAMPLLYLFSQGQSNVVFLFHSTYICLIDGFKSFKAERNVLNLPQVLHLI